MKKNTLVAISFIFGFLAPLGAFANMMDRDDYAWMGQMMGGFWPWMGGGMFFGLIIWILIIIGIIYLIKWLVTGGHYKESEKRNSAIEILKDRYAKGEIGKEEFEEKMKDITK